MTLSSDSNVNRYIDQQLRTLAVKALAVIYRGALVGLDRLCGCARPLQAADQFQGLAYEKCDNAAGADGGREVTIFTEGDFEFALAGATKTAIGRPVFATDDNTLTFAGGSASYVGRIVDVPAAGSIIVRIDPQRRFTANVCVPLASSTAAAAKNPVGCWSTPIVVVKAQCWFETKPDQGALDVGADAADPDEIVDSFNLTTLVDGTPSNLILAGTTVAANTRLWASVGQANAAAGVGGGLAIEYFPLP